MLPRHQDDSRRWSHLGRREYDYCVSKIETLHISHNMYLTTLAVSPYWNNVTKHPLPVHGRHTREARDSDGQARNCIRFLQDRKGPGVPKYYSFSNDEG